MIYEQRKIVKKFQIALRRTIHGSQIESTHFIYKYIKKEDLIKRLESNFIEGMTWDNFGDVWEISHLIPVIFFDHTKEEDLKLCWNTKNIIPLLKEDNKNFGSCLLFAKSWFNFNFDKEDYTDYILFLNDKMPVYSKYITKNEKNN